MLPAEPARPARLRSGPWVAALLCTLTLTGCEAGRHLLGRKVPPPAPVLSEAESTRQLLVWLEEVGQASPAQQSEMVAAVRSGWEERRSPEDRLRLGLALANPRLPGADALQARQHLGELLAREEPSMPAASRTLARWTLAALDARLALQSENLRLQTVGAERDRDRTVALTRRLQQELDESNRLRRALEDAQKKLAAIIELERGKVTPSASATAAPSAPPPAAPRPPKRP